MLPLVIGKVFIKLVGAVPVLAAIPAFEDIVGGAPHERVECLFVAQVFDALAKCQQYFLRQVLGLLI